MVVTPSFKIAIAQEGPILACAIKGLVNSPAMIFLPCLEGSFLTACSVSKLGASIIVLCH